MRLRVTLFTALATLVVASIVWATEPFNTSGRWACFSGTCIIGSTRAPAIQLLTDGTGNGEVVLPTGAISTTEVTDDSLTFADISNSSAIDETTYFTAADTISLELIPSATAGDTDFFVINANQVDDTNATDDFRAMVMELTSESGDAGDTFGGIAIEWEDGTANTILDYAIKIDNQEDTTATLTDGILFTSTTADGIADAIDASAANINNAINIGANDIQGGNSDKIQVGSTDNSLTLTVDGTNTATFVGADAASPANTLLDTTGAGAIDVGSADVTSVDVITDGGTVTIDGTITSTATSDLGWSIQTGANTACNTTCTSACVMGFELDAWDNTSLLACDDATADACLCAGSS